MTTSLAPRPACSDCDLQAGLVDVEIARARLLADVHPVRGVELVSLSAAARRVLANPVLATSDMPPFDRAAVDGYGVGGPGPGPFQVVGYLPAGAGGLPRVGAGEAVRLLTGAAVPEGVWAVAMQEGCRVDPHSGVASPTLLQDANIRRRGEDFQAGEAVLEAGTRLDPRHLALLAAVGVGDVAVRRRPRVAVPSAGDKLLEPGMPHAPGAIHDSNRPMLAALLRGMGVEILGLGLLPDRRSDIAAALERASGCNAIVASGGVSGSEADHLLGALHDAGGHGSWCAVALKPGKPLVFGGIGTARCLFLPGNLVAALVSGILFGRPLVARLTGAVDGGLKSLPARLASGWDRKPGREEFAPAMVGPDLVVEHISKPGSARLMPLVAADG
ncbi:molybdopterin molybdotransferase MoeA [Roseomonas mucosa]|uniref:molybdopterin molybdotransferase MoeA n=1 Tax=Roseomonas mucosa TaxID=207340 RepID=UPI0022485047|nr:molybdopterin molybdotransferase MoeA [Roseomonas mucosa]UZO92302.1 Molybdopterin biosynthesis MoeA protein [Roseomonas mucosa]